MDLRELHKIRIKNDYYNLSKLESGGLFTWEAVKGVPPHVEEYLFHIRIPGFISPDVRNDEWTVKLKLDPNYPNVAPIIQMIGEKQIFHPHWYTEGRWDYGCYQPSLPLARVVLSMLHDMAYDPAYINVNIPSNQSAARWYKEHANGDLFPTIQVDDYIKFPEPKFKVVKK